MSSSSPDDLAVAFRSMTRRLVEAQAGAPHDLIAAPVAELHGLIAEAGRLLGTLATPDAVAEAIHATPADEWDEAVLDRLREIALDLGRLLRHIAALAEGD